MTWFDDFSRSPVIVYALIILLAIVFIAFIVVTFRYRRQQRDILRHEEIDREVARRRRIRVSDKNEVFERDNYTCQICGISKDYLDSLCWIGDISDGSLILIELDNAFNTADFSMTFTDKSEGTMTFEFHARQADVMDYDKAPFRVVFFGNT